MATPASDEVDAAMHLLDQDDEVATEQPATANPTADQLTVGLNRMLNNMAKIGPPPPRLPEPTPPWLNTVMGSPLRTIGLGQQGAIP